MRVRVRTGNVRRWYINGSGDVRAAPSTDRGAMTVLVVLVALAMTAAITLAMVPVLGDLTDRQQARSAADAAALAGVTGGRSAAAAMAAHNDADLVEWRRTGREVTVRVRVGDQVVAARATDGP